MNICMTIFIRYSNDFYEVAHAEEQNTSQEEDFSRICDYFSCIDSFSLSSCISNDLLFGILWPEG